MRAKPSPRHLSVFAVLVGVVSLVGGSALFAAEPSVMTVTLSGRSFATEVKVTLGAPAGYTASPPGRWTGPRWKKATGEGDAALSFNVGSGGNAVTSAEQAARSKLGAYSGWAEVASGPIDVPHRAGGRTLGVFKGFFLIRHNTARGYEGWYKASVAFALGAGYPVIVADFGTTTPSDDAGTTIEGTTPSVWNGRAIEQALRGVAVDVRLASTTTATCRGKHATVAGTTGTAGDDVIVGRDGNDELRGLGGNDTICGGGGDDTISGGDGKDELSGGAGADRLDGGGRDDRLEGGTGHDRLEGGPGLDLLFGATGDDRLQGQGHRDRLEGGSGNDRIEGGGGDDELLGERGNDRLEGGNDDDRIGGGEGNDELKGGADEDTLDGGDGDDELEGNGGHDNLYGRDGDDRLRGGHGLDGLLGGSGSDYLRGGPGRDVLIGGPGHDDCGTEGGTGAAGSCEE